MKTKAPLHTTSFYQLHEMGFDEDTLDWLHSCLEDGFHTMRDVVGFLEDYDTAKALEVSEQYDQNTNVLVIESKS
jgi:hypothetical protein